MLYAVIVAGGSGSRMNSKVPKQFLELEGKPILYHTIQRFLDFDANMKIIVVLPADQVASSSFLTNYFPSQKNIQLAKGGSTRYQSVQSGLSLINEDGIVMIHDGVRPFVHSNVIRECIEVASNNGNAIPCIPLKDSLRRIEDESNYAVLRDEFRAVQTPQTFQISLIKEALKQPDHPSFTDEASVLEKLGKKICLVNGNEENIKITTPLDLVMAEWIIKNKSLD